MGVLLKDSQIKTKVNNKRRRKKRRTEDFSSDSDSSSSSSSASSSESEESNTVENPLQTQDKTDVISRQDITLNGIEFNSNVQQQVISDETKLKLSSIKITNIPNLTSLNKDELVKIRAELNKEEQDLHNQFLVKMMNEHDGDLDQLRVKPDFTTKSLPLLAKILKNGANLFDDESLKTILKS